MILVESKCANDIRFSTTFSLKLRAKLASFPPKAIIYPSHAKYALCVYSACRCEDILLACRVEWARYKCHKSIKKNLTKLISDSISLKPARVISCVITFVTMETCGDKDQEECWSSPLWNNLHISVWWRRVWNITSTYINEAFGDWKYPRTDLKICTLVIYLKIHTITISLYIPWIFLLPLCKIIE